MIESQLAFASITVPSMEEEADLIELAWLINSLSNKLREEEEEEEEEEEDKEKVRFLLLDLQVYGNYFLTLGKHSWWRISPQYLDLLSDKVTENRRMRHSIMLSIENYRHLPNKISVLVEQMLEWKEQLVQNYSVLLDAKSESEGYVSCKNMLQFTTNIGSIAVDMLRCRDDLDNDEKQVLHASLANLRFFKAFVQLAESEGMGSLLNCIQDYTRKVEVLLFHLWTGKTQGESRNRLLSALKQGGVNVDFPCSLLIILDIFKLPKKILLGEEGMCWDNEPSGRVIFQISIWDSILDYIPGFLKDNFSKDLLYDVSRLKDDPELKGGIQLLHEQVTFLASFIDDLSLDMRVLFVRAATSLGFICVFSFQDLSSEEDLITQVKFQLSILNASLHICREEVMLMNPLSHASELTIFMMSLHKDLLDGLKFLREHLTYVEDGYLEDNVILMSHIEFLLCDKLSFFDLLDCHEIDEDDCIEIDLAFLKLVGTTKLVQAHVLAQELVNCHNEFHMEEQLIKMRDKLGFLVDLVKEMEEVNVDSVLYLLDIGVVAKEVESLVSLSSMDMSEERLEEGNSRLVQLIDHIELLETETMLNSFLNHQSTAHFSNIDMIRKGFRLLRIVLTDSTEHDSVDKELVVSGGKLVKYAIPHVSKLFQHKSDKFVSIELNDLASDLLRNMIAWEEEVTACYIEIRKSSRSTHPMTDRLGFIDSLGYTLSDFSSSMPAFPWMKYQIGTAFKDLKYCRSLLNDKLWEHKEDSEVDNLVSQLTQAAYEMEYVFEAFAIGDSNGWAKRLWISNLIDEIKQISVKIKDVLKNKAYNNFGMDKSLETSDRVLARPVDNNTPSSINEVVVGMKEHEEKVTNQLMRGPTELCIVSIVGMKGLGKTTLAKKVFDSPSIQQSFDMCCWCRISKVFQKRELLLEILGYLLKVTPEIQEKLDDDGLSDMLKKLLRKRSYLIVMDNMWDLQAWYELQQCFPKGDNKRSRVLFTSQINDIASKTGYGLDPCSLDFLSDMQSWELLERKVFDGGSCPLQLREVGWEIAVKCKGLPLAIAVISGLLSTKEMNLDWWKQVAENLMSSVVAVNSETDKSLGDLTDHHVLLQEAVVNNTVVDIMKEHEEKVTNQLLRGTKEVRIVSIVGKEGLGKTALAKKVYDSASVQRSFDICAWCFISKTHRKKEILLEILSYIAVVPPENLNDDDLSQMLWRLLRGRSYLIVFDNICDIRAWNEVQHCFPKGDNNGSRILFTSRINNIASKSSYGLEPYSLESDKQSWELLERKVFDDGSTTLQSTFKKIIHLSYHYLPEYLKPCFLYFAVFQEDKTILASNLIDLWISEGFVGRRNDNNKNMNDVAHGYLLELVSRNMVSVAERTSTAGIKTCHLHNLLRELCCTKAVEENFLHVAKNFYESESFITNEHRRVCIYSEERNFVKLRPFGQYVRSVLLFGKRGNEYLIDEYNVSFISLNFKLLRTLKLDSINIGDSLHLSGFELLIHLRFLALMGTMKSIPDSINSLSNLEFFSVKGLRGEILVPHSIIWRLKKLRKLHVRDRFAFRLLTEKEEVVMDLDNLESVSSVFLPYGESTDQILLRLSRLRKLKCIFSESWSNNNTKKSNLFPVLDSLNQLESLKVIYDGGKEEVRRQQQHPCVFSFPANIKKLSLSKFRLPWKDMLYIGSLLPRLEVLKLMGEAFEGEEWEVGDKEFRKLKYLKMDSIEIVRWIASYDTFPCLEQIVLQSCKKLEEVPFEFGESSTLKTIKVQWCNRSVAKSVKLIQTEQMDTLVRHLNVFIHPPDF